MNAAIGINFGDNDFGKSWITQAIVPDSEKLVTGELTVVHYHNAWVSGTYGRMMYLKSQFLGIKGYDASFLPVGCQDTDLKRRLEKGGTGLTDRDPRVGFAVPNAEGGGRDECLAAKVKNVRLNGLTFNQMDARNRTKMHENLKNLPSPVRNAGLQWFLPVESITMRPVMKAYDDELDYDPWEDDVPPAGPVPPKIMLSTLGAAKLVLAFPGNDMPRAQEMHLLGKRGGKPVAIPEEMASAALRECGLTPRQGRRRSLSTAVVSSTLQATRRGDTPAPTRSSSRSCRRTGTSGSSGRCF